MFVCSFVRLFVCSFVRLFVCFVCIPSLYTQLFTINAHLQQSLVLSAVEKENAALRVDVDDAAAAATAAAAAAAADDAAAAIDAITDAERAGEARLAEANGESRCML
jgi:hypothetical protein